MTSVPHLRHCVLGFVFVYWMIVGLSSPSRAEDSGASRVTLLRVPGGSIQPQAICDAGGTVHLIDFRGDPAHGDLYYARREAGRPEFGPPVRVNSQQGSAIAVGTIRGGQIALGRDGRVHVAWNGSNTARPRPSGGGSPMLYARSDPGATVFEPQRNLMQKTIELDGGGTVAADSRGHVYVAWHARTEDAPSGEVRRRMWVARSLDDGATFSPELPAFDRETGACGCCGTRALADRRGTLRILYRAATASVDRDIYLLTSRDDGAHFEGRVMEPWKISMCPMSSASLADAGTSVLAAWETEGRVSFARIDPDSGKVSPPITPSGHPGGRKHPAVASNVRGEMILVWTEGTGWQKGGSLSWQVFDPSGKPAGKRGFLKDAVPVWGLATVVATPSGEFLIVY